MDKEKAFMNVGRKDPQPDRVKSRINDYREFYRSLSVDEIREQAARCMDCGTPFCHGFGCPLENLVPEWNELVYRGNWKEAALRLCRTSPFPEFTSRLCPALCESACTLGLGFEPVSVRAIELAVIEKAFKEGWIYPKPPFERSGCRVAVIGSGPAGLAAADRLNRLGHEVEVFEKFEKPGGLLRFGIPDFKIEKHIIDRRIRILKEEGIEFSCDVEIGSDLSIGYIQKKYDAAVAAIGCWVPREIPVKGSSLEGIHFALDYLIQQNRINSGEEIPDAERITAQGKNVVVIGGGDTGADCIGTAVRQRASEIIQIEILPKPPEKRPDSMPWPTHPRLYKETSSHKEGGRRMWSVMTKEFTGRDGRVTGLECAESVLNNGKIEEKKGTDFRIDADLVILAAGFIHPGHDLVVDPAGIRKDTRGNIKTDNSGMTSVPGFFSAGDAVSGPSLVVKAIANGIETACGVNSYLKDL